MVLYFNYINYYVHPTAAQSMWSYFGVRPRELTSHPPLTLSLYYIKTFLEIYTSIHRHIFLVVYGGCIPIVSCHLPQANYLKCMHLKMTVSDYDIISVLLPKDFLRVETISP